jgi:GH25 family lysozyme M1 (1,4-beta-N-acetylmuramidase)
MHGDFSRDSFKPGKQYVAVRQQQGRVQLDADWNEQIDIVNHALQVRARDVIGVSGAPRQGGGYELVAQNVLVFDGVATHADLGARRDFSFVDRSPFTFELMVRVRSTERGGTLLCGVGPGGRVWYRLGLDSDGCLRVTRGLHGKAVISSPIDWDSPRHVAAVYDGTDLCLYVDGVEVGREPRTEPLSIRRVQPTSGGDVTIVQSVVVEGAEKVPDRIEVTKDSRDAAEDDASLLTLSVRIGSDLREGQPFLPLDGDLHWFRIWQVARTPTQLITSCGRTLDPNLRGLVGDWPLQEGFGSTSADRTPVCQELRLDLGRLSNQPGWKLIDLHISSGRFYIDGMVCENFERSTLDSQPQDPGTRMPEHPGIYLAYLDAWLRPVSALRDPSIREVALGGVDTAIRQQLVSQVRLLKLRDDPTAELDGRLGQDEEVWRALCLRAEERGGMRARRSRRLGAEPIGNQLYRVEVHRGGARFGTPLDERGVHPTFSSAVDAAAAGTLLLPEVALAEPTWVVGQWLSLHFAEAQHLTCIVDRVGARLTLEPAPPVGLVGEVTARPVASLVWSRNNGSELMVVRSASGREIFLERSVDSTGHTLQVHDLIALSTDRTELRRHPAQLLRIDSISSDGRKLRVDQPVALGEEDLADTKPLVRRWGRASRRGPHGVPICADWIELEHGIEVSFDGANSHADGDYWLMPSRAQTRSIQWPISDDGPQLVAPKGGGHRHARLSLLRVKDGGVAVHDLRRTFATLTGAEGGDDEEAVQATLTVPEKLHVTGDATVNGAVTAGLFRGVLANGMVDAPQLRDRAVTGSKIGTGAVHLRQLNADVGIVPTGSSVLGDSPHPPPGFDYTFQQVPISNVRPSWRSQKPPESPSLDRAICVPIGDMLYVILDNGELWCTGGNAGTGWHLDAEMRPIRRDFAAAAVGGRIHIVGGVDETGLPLADHDVYDTVERVWEKGPPLPSPRWGLSLAASGGVLFAIGGMQAPLVSTAWRGWLRKIGLGASWFRWVHSVRRVDVYEPARARWVNSFPLAQGRCNASVAVFNDRIHVVGGRSSSLMGWERPLASHEAFSPSQGRWTERMPLAEGRSELGLAGAGSNLYAVGGNSQGGPTAQVERYEPLSDTWHPAPALPAARRDAGVCGWLGNIFVVGGVGTEGMVSSVEVCTLSRTLYVHRKVSLPTVDGTRGHVQYEHVVSSSASAGLTPGSDIAASAAATATAAAASIAGSGVHVQAARSGAPSIAGSQGGAALHALESPEAETAGRALRTILVAGLVLGLAIFVCVGVTRTLSRFLQSPEFDQLVCEGVAYTFAAPLGFCAAPVSGAGGPAGIGTLPIGAVSPAGAVAPPIAIQPPAPTASCVDALGDAPVINFGQVDMSRVFGVDVSHYQNDVPWSALRTQGVLFAYAKATEGMRGVDPKFYENWSMMQQCGLLRGAYHYYRHDEDPVRQAQNFVNTVQALGAGELPLVLDLETGYDRRQQRDCKVVLPNAVLFLQTVAQSTGQPVMVYSSAPVWNEFFSCSSEPDAIRAQAALASYPLWTSHYQPSDPPLFGRWNEWSLWQYSSSGVLGDGQVDLNQFPGDYTLLSNWLTALATNPSITPSQVAAAGAAPVPGVPVTAAPGSPAPLPRPALPAALPGVQAPAALPPAVGVPALPSMPLPMPLPALPVAPPAAAPPVAPAAPATAPQPPMGSPP